MKKLIICEKKEAATDLSISGALGSGFKSGNGYLENNDYIITYALGHLYRLMTPSEINEEYGLKYKITQGYDYNIPTLNKEAKYIPDIVPPANVKDAGMKKFYDMKKNQLNVIKSLIQRNDYDEIILAADGDAEGERIHSDIYYFNKKLIKNSNISVTRLWNTGSYKSKVSSTKAIQDRKPINDAKYSNLLASAQSRGMGDYLVGMKLTKLLTDKSTALFRVGRVYSVVIGILGRREDERANFVPKDYWNIKGLIGGNENDFNNKKESLLTLNHFYDDVEIDEDGNEKKVSGTRYFDKNVVDNIINKIKTVNLTGTVIKNTKRVTSSKKPKLYNTDEFNSKFMDLYKVDYDYSNACLEWLRDNEYTSYPRTDGNYFQTDDFNDANDAILNAKSFYQKEIAEISKNDVNFTVSALDTKNGIFDNKKAAEQNHTPLIIKKTLSLNDETKLKSTQTHNNLQLNHLHEAYSMIAKRCLIQVLPDDIVEKRNLTVDIGGYLFETNSEKTTYLGWKQLDDNANVTNSKDINVNYNEGDKIILDDVFTIDGKTTIPPEYTNITLLNALMNVNDALTDEFNGIIDPNEKKQKMASFKDIKKILSNVKGIGTQATRKTIFDKLIKDKVIDINKKKVVSLTENGKYQYKYLPNFVKSLETTAIWEQNLENVRLGKMSYGDFINMVEQSIQNVIPNVLSTNIPKNFVNNGSGGSGSNKPTASMLSYAEKIAVKLNLKLTKEQKSSFNEISKFINDNKQSYSEKFSSTSTGSGDSRTLSPKQKSLILNPKSNASDEIKELAEKETLNNEEFEIVNNFIKEVFERINDNKNNSSNGFSKPSGKRVLSDKQKLFIKNEKNNASKELLDIVDNDEYSDKEYEQLTNFIKTKIQEMKK